MTPASSDNAFARQFETSLVEAITAAAPQAAIVRDWRAADRCVVDIVVGFETSVFVVEAKAWAGTIIREAGTLRIGDDSRVFRVPDPRPWLQQVLSPLREARNRFVHGGAGNTNEEQLLLHASIVVPDGTSLPQADQAAAIDILTVSELCDRLRRCHEPGISVAELTAKLDRIVAKETGAAARGRLRRTSPGMPAAGEAFVGRTDLVISLARAASRGKRVVLVGRRGLGKTSVLYAVRERLESPNRQVKWVNLGTSGQAIAQLFGQLRRNAVVLLDDADARPNDAEASAETLRIAIEQSQAAIVAAGTGTPWFLDGASPAHLAGWTVLSLGGFEAADVRTLCSSLPNPLVEQAADIAWLKLGGHPLLCRMFIDAVHESGVDDESALSVAIDQIYRFLDLHGVGHIPLEMADLLVRSGFETKAMPLSQRPLAEALTSTGWFTLEGWTLKPVAPIVADVVAASLAERGKKDAAPQRVSLADQSDPWQPFLDAVTAVWTAEGVLDLFEVKRPVEADFDLRVHVADTLGLESVREVLVTWFGHRDRRKLAVHIGLDIGDIPSEELGATILDALLKSQKNGAEP